ncbi:MAG: hypothetical protein PHQ12_02170 [Chthoniobacteraceae bacterium]|nr:hypothetical protein [Chthoniobacteraceae bacterium]
MLALTAWGGDAPSSAPAPRREFRQRKTYPFIFEPVPYLENGAPVPMQFTDAGAERVHPDPPRVPKPTPKPTPVPTPTPTPKLKTKPSPTPEPSASPSVEQPTPEPSPALPAASPEPAYPAPDNAQPVPRQDALDMTKYPAEVVDIFKNPYNVPKSRKNFFDPVFEPAQPPQAPAQPSQSPASRASFRQE